jgi:hypothetical protein
MIRTQVYLTKREKDQLETIADTKGVKQSVLIRQAVDKLIEEQTPERRRALIQGVFGIWKNRKDLPDLRDLRRGWCRRMERIETK